MDVVDLVDEGDALAKPLSAGGEAENIAVCIRVRPLNEREVRSRDCNVLRTLDAANAISVTDVDGAPLGGKHNVFQYDHIFDETRSTRHMYRRVAQRIVRSTLEGINGTIFAYGQTSSGKTYTMQGDDASGDAGILQLAVDDIFAYIERCDDRDFLLRVSFVEIYNEVVRDLLAPGDRGASLKLREDPRKGVYVECHEEIITSQREILALLAQGNARRAVGHTAVNDRSSRSHSIFRVVVESKQRSPADDDEGGAVLVACLSLVDLAGSESVRHTAAEGLRQREAGSINKSLLTLARVIHSLASAAAAVQSAPFRDSKLTRLLQNSLDGNTRTLIVCCVTPSDRFLDETRSTLQFAARAKHIQTAASVNEVLDDRAQLKRLQREVRELKRLVDSDALGQLKAENEALVHEQNRHKSEHARLLSLILTSASRAAPPSDGRDRKARAKRTRGTWCPGDFSDFPASRSAPPPSPNLQPRKRRSTSDAKENVVPQNLLRAMNDEADEADADNDGDDGDRMHVLTAKLLGVLELALQSYRDDGGDDTFRELNDAIAQAHELVAWEEDQERLAELLQDVRALVDMSANAEHLRGENELLNMEVEELHRKLELLSDSSAPSSQEERGSSSSSAESLNAAKMQLAEAQRALAEERELVAELSRQKQIAELTATEDVKALEEQLEALRLEMDAKQAAALAEKQRLEGALADASDEIAQVTQHHEAQRQQVASEHAALTDAMTALEQQLQQTAKCHADLEAQVAFVVAEKSALAVKVEALESELTEDKTIRAAAATQAESDDREAVLSSELQSLLQDLSTLQLALETATTENEALGAERDAARQELEKVRGQQLGGDDAREALEALKQSSSEEIARLRRDLAFAMNETQASALNIQDLSAERAQLTEALRSIKDEMDQVLGESLQKTYRLESEVADLRASHDARASDSESLRAELAAAREEAAQLRATLEELEEQKHAAASSLETLEAEQASHASRVEALSVENAELKESSHAFGLERLAWLEKSASNDNVQREIGRMREEHSRLSLLVEELETRLAAGRLDAGEASDSQVSKLSAEVLEYEATVAEQATAIEQLRAELALGDEEHAALRARVEELEEQAERATSSVGGGDADAGAQARVAALEEEIEKVSAELDTVAAQRSELFEELSALESQLMDESQEKLRLRAAVDALETQRRECGAPAELASELERAKQAESVLLNELETLSTAMETLEAEHRSLRESRRASGGGGGGGDDDDDDDAAALRQRLVLERELRATLELDVKSYEDALQVIRSELKGSAEAMSELLEKLKAMEQETAALSQAKAAAERDAAAARELTQRAKEEQEELRFQNQQRARATEALEQQLVAAKQAIRSQQEVLATNESSSTLEKTVADLQEQLLAARKALAVQADEWRAEAEQQVARVTGELETRTRALTELQQDRRVLEQQLGEIDAKWRAKEQALSQQVAAELTSAKQAVSDLAALKDAEMRERDAAWRAKELALSQQAAAELDSVREQYQAAQEELDAYQRYADDEIHKLRAAVEASDVEAAIAAARDEERGGRQREQEQQAAAKVAELENECAELLVERKALEEKLQSLLSTRDDAVDHLEHELRAAAALATELKAAVEQLEGEAYKHRDEREDTAEALRSAQLEATHYQQQLAAAQRAKAELETLVETQRRRVDKLEKVKMTTETLELFRKLKADRAELQAQVLAAQRELDAAAQAKASATQHTNRLLERKEAELAVAREHIEELELALQAETASAAAAARDATERAQEAIRELEEQLRESTASAQALVAEKSGSVTFLEKENLELLVENRQLKKRLEGGAASTSSLSLLADAPDADPSAAAAAAILAEPKGGSSFLLSSADEKSEAVEDGARPACAQQ